MSKKNTQATVTLSHPSSKKQIEVPRNRLPMYQSQGWSEATAGAPRANASLEEWQDFARTQGLTDEDLEGMKRDEIRAALA